MTRPTCSWVIMELDWFRLTLESGSRKAANCRYSGGHLFVCSSGLGETKDACQVYVAYVPAIRALIVKPVNCSNMDTKGDLALDIDSIHVSACLSARRGKYSCNLSRSTRSNICLLYI